MPGHFGYVSRHMPSVDIPRTEAIRTYHSGHMPLDVYRANGVLQSLVKDQRERTVGYVQQGEIHYWLDGEVYGENQRFSDFQDWDGVFSMVIFDEGKKQLLLVSDPLGIKPLYWYQTSDLIAWSSEIKCFACLDEIPWSFNKEGILDFIAQGHYPGNETPVDGVELIPPGSVVVIDVNDLSFTIEKYFELEKSSKSGVTLSEAIEETTRLLQTSIEKRSFSNEKSSIALTGGLDSRCIASKVHNSKPLSFTFGMQESDDLLLAQRVATALGMEHRHLTCDDENWMQGKQEAVWRTEGMFSYFELHTSPFTSQMIQLGDSVWNGFGGATVLGGIFQGKASKYPQYQGSAEDFESWVLREHVRRRVVQGSIDVGKYLVQRKPYAARELITFIWSLPDSFRKNYQLFRGVARNLCPSEVLKIPWENTMLPFENQFLTSLALTLKWPGIRRKAGWTNKAFDYPRWSRQDAFKQNIKSYFDKSHQLWNVIEHKDWRALNFEELGRYVSSAIWIDQFTKGRP